MKAQELQTCQVQDNKVDIETDWSYYDSYI